MGGWHGLFEQAYSKLPGTGGEHHATLFMHGSLKVLLYAPREVDHQVPHDRDEVYVIVKGSGTFKLGDNRFSFQAGDIIFVPAGEEHRFEEFSDDLAAWVMFYGPTGGEVPEANEDGS